MKLTDLIEGITARTSQHDKRTEAAIDVIGKALNASPLRRFPKVDGFEDALINLAGFFDESSPDEMEWWFPATFNDLQLHKKDRSSPHVKNALVYLAQRYNQIEQQEEEHFQKTGIHTWLRNIVRGVHAKVDP